MIAHRALPALLAALLLGAVPHPALAQGPAPSPDVSAGASVEAGGPDGASAEAADEPADPVEPPAAPQPSQPEDRVLVLAQPDFTLVNLPTTLRVPRFRSAFRVTHRFARPLGQGDFSSLVEDLFGLDAGAEIGLEYRFGLISGGQVGIHRTSRKTIQLFAQYQVIRQSEERPLSLDVLWTMDGTNNFRDTYTPALGVVISRLIGRQAGLYAVPMWVNNSNPLPAELVEHNSTYLLGLGARVRVRPTVYLVGEITPRLAGFDPGVTHMAFAIEKRAGGHSFQLNVQNSLGTTMAQIARGGLTNDDWFLGFNISRKFF